LREQRCLRFGPVPFAQRQRPPQFLYAGQRGKLEPPIEIVAMYE
jgi:hypothetical protein